MSLSWKGISGKNIVLSESITFREKTIKGKKKYLIFNFSTGLGMILNNSGGLILEKIGKKTSAGSLLKALLAEFPKKKEPVLKKDLTKFVCELEHEKVIRIE